jgi:ADP-ribose pyrophosphatase YjhB (NUDIX family)
MVKTISLAEAQSNETFKPFIMEGELEKLKDTFPNVQPYHATLEFNKYNFEYWNNIVNKQKNRRGEVLFAIKNDGKLLLHTKHHYPNLVFRLPTGGIHYGETVLDALDREVDEETGMKIMTLELHSILFYEMHNNGISIPFISYIFLVETDHTDPVVQDEGESIAEFKWHPMNQLDEIVAELKASPNDWKDWGDMRAIPHELISRSD